MICTEKLCLKSLASACRSANGEKREGVSLFWMMAAYVGSKDVAEVTRPTNTSIELNCLNCRPIDIFRRMDGRIDG